MSSSYRVVATLRSPDRAPYGRIAGLVIEGYFGRQQIGLAEAIRMAAAGQLWTTTPWNTNPVRVVAVDENRDGDLDYVTTAPDVTTANNLLSLPIEASNLSPFASLLG